MLIYLLKKMRKNFLSFKKLKFKELKINSKTFAKGFYLVPHDRILMNLALHLPPWLIR